jgi:hypothetical protein
MSTLTPIPDETELVERLEWCLKATRFIGERSASLAIEDALDDIRTRFRLHPAQVAEDRCEREIEQEHARANRSSW